MAVTVPGIACFELCGTWGKPGVWDACDCPDVCYPEGVIATQTIRILEQKAAETVADAAAAPWFHAMGFKRPHLTCEGHCCPGATFS